MRTIPLTARDPRPFTPPALAKLHENALEEHQRAKGKPADKPKKPVFYIAVPTLVERETIGSFMFELGLVQVTLDSIRNATLKAAKELIEGDAGEETALFLESHWQQTAIHDEQVDLWQQQESQRLIDEWEDRGTAREPYPMPPALTTLDDRIRAKEVVDDLIARSRTLRRLFAAQARFSKENEIMMLRVHLRSWDGLATTREAEGGGGEAELVTEECIDALREEIGPKAWKELWQEVDGQYHLAADEVGNSASPPASGRKNDGSTPSPGEESGDSRGTASATSSSSEQIPEAG
jgi:hypothetical protein